MESPKWVNALVRQKSGDLTHFPVPGGRHGRKLNILPHKIRE